MDEHRDRIAEILISLECIQLSPSKPFTYASGLLGPIYCDNRKILSHVGQRGEILNAFTRCIVHSGVQYNAVAGVATAGIPMASLIAHQLGLPLCYVRAKAKEHGKKNLIEGDLAQNRDIIMVEDLVNQGKSIADAIDAVKMQGHKVSAVFCIVDYEMQAAQEKLRELGIPLYSLVSFSDIIKYCKKYGALAISEIELLESWQSNPTEWTVN
ncbi:MAG: orotate phosphoribosyltransferase [Halobacteriovoraceae bacterium]|nr:orotate phosphoribosyltransferase [Halobacteriovoraceae bacterium]